MEDEGSSRDSYRAALSLPRYSLTCLLMLVLAWGAWGALATSFGVMTMLVNVWIPLVFLAVWFAAVQALDAFKVERTRSRCAILALALGVTILALFPSIVCNLPERAEHHAKIARTREMGVERRLDSLAEAERLHPGKAFLAAENLLDDPDARILTEALQTILRGLASRPEARLGMGERCQVRALFEHPQAEVAALAKQVDSLCERGEKKRETGNPSR